MYKESRDNSYWQIVWLKFKTGDRESFEEIYNEFVDHLFAYGSKITNDRELLKDCIQDLFIDIYKYSPNIKKPELLEFYLYKSLKHLIIKRLQKEKRLQGVDIGLSSFDLVFYSETDSFPEEFKSEQIRLLQKVLQTLDAHKRELLFLKFDSGLNYIEIGDLLNLKPDTVKKQVYRIIQYLRDNFGSQFLDFLFMCYRA